VALQSPAGAIVEQLYSPQSSQSALQAGSPTLRFTVAAAGSETALGSGTARANPPATLTPSGSQLDVQDPGLATTELRFEPQGGVNAEVGMQAGAPDVNQFSGILTPPGSQLRAEIPNYMEAFYDVIPDGGETAAQAGTGQVFIPLLVVATGSQFTTQAGTPALAMQLLPIGSEYRLQSGAPLLPNLPVLLVPPGGQFASQHGAPLLLERIFPTGSQVAVQGTVGLLLHQILAQGSQVSEQSSVPTVGSFGLALLPFGSEVRQQQSSPDLSWYLVPVGTELVLEYTIPTLPGLRQIRIKLTDASGPVWELVDSSGPRFTLEVTDDR
jgi:hypothetical protein